MHAQAHPHTCLGRIRNLCIRNLHKSFSISTHRKCIVLIDTPARCILQVPLLG
ncbi:hypothetical protein RHMOL_Rhmol11G0071500 [Rhododendron molle]|uniref:Uncharacterized protein n=1 Tax=Rhododendron molle TaxID=49168 RepID=A0ACC0LPX2_RHOML|nr:hypothetical protein RHMOL_Rhmol11G0071500 [Rhododendron molle]